jgi:LmbE family N-acetylglucosaminyl deacetylase/glycosyltransferase involved in cell wall biosynthesis
MIGKRESSHIGEVEFYSRSFVSGWAVNLQAPNDPVSILVVRDNQILEEFFPNLFRWDLQQRGYGHGYHGFRFPLSPTFFDGHRHELHFRFSKTGEALSHSPVRLCNIEESRFVPFHTSQLSGHRTLVLAPHADDETFGCGGSIIHHCQNGDPVKVVLMTDGGQGDVKDQHSRETYIAIREAEARKACQILGTNDLEFWRCPDRNCALTTEVVDRLSTLLNTYRPSLIYACSPIEFHPDHQSVAAILWRALQQTQISAQVAWYEVNSPFRINTLVDISSVMEQKKRACEAYVSQLDNYPYTDFVESLNRYRALTVAGSCQHAEGFLVCDAARIKQDTPEMFVLKQVFPTARLKETEQPLVSIIVRTKNRLTLLRDALSSIATQTYPSIEVIVVNDGGPDVGPVVAEFEKFLKIRMLNLESSQGRSAAANIGLREAKGTYINFLDDDDLLLSNHVEKLAEYLTVTGEHFAYSDCEKGHYCWQQNEFELAGKKTPFWGIDFDPEQLRSENYIPMMTAMFSSDLLSRVGFLDESLDALEDWDLWIRMSQECCFHRVPGISAEYRIFGKHGYDYPHWKSRIFDKHERTGSKDEVRRWAQSRVDALQEENLHLRRLLKDNQSRISSTKSLPRYLRNPLLWRINRFARGHFERLFGTSSRH